MGFINKNKKYLVLGGAILLLLVISIFIYNNFSNDGMNNKGIYNIKYRVYQNGKWSWYTKNGMTIGDKEHPINNIEFKYKENKGLIHYHIYIDDEWTEQLYNSINTNEKNLTGIKIGDSNVLYKKYDICYRTYNKKDKWLNWTCNDKMSGNKDEPITAIEIKLIPKGSDKKEYLRDYNEELESSKGFLQGEKHEEDN